MWFCTYISYYIISVLLCQLFLQRIHKFNRATKNAPLLVRFSIGQYRTKIVRQMRRQIFRQMKQKAEWILDVFTSIFVKYESLFRIWRMQIASSDFLRDEGKNGENPLWIFEYFPEISRKICTQDACEKIRNRLWREICKQMACKVARRSLCGIAFIHMHEFHGHAAENCRHSPVSGSGNSSESQCSMWWGNCSELVPYSRSPARGYPRYAMCTRIWWVRPVSSCRESSVQVPSLRSGV